MNLFVILQRMSRQRSLSFRGCSLFLRGVVLPIPRPSGSPHWTEEGQQKGKELPAGKRGFAKSRSLGGDMGGVPENAALDKLASLYSINDKIDLKVKRHHSKVRRRKQLQGM